MSRKFAIVAVVCAALTTPVLAENSETPHLEFVKLYIAQLEAVENIRDAAKQVPLDRMLIETDSPYLAPVPHRGKRNEPSFVVNTAETIAQLRGSNKEEIGQKTTENFYQLFPQTR